jgi:hypothetical protein
LISSPDPWDTYALPSPWKEYLTRTTSQSGEGTKIGRQREALTEAICSSLNAYPYSRYAVHKHMLNAVQVPPILVKNKIIKKNQTKLQETLKQARRSRIAR